jgi:hypothetical protein
MRPPGRLAINPLILIDALKEPEPAKARAKFFVAVQERDQRGKKEIDLLDQAVEAFERDVFNAVTLGDQDISITAERAVLIVLALKERKRKRGGQRVTWHQRLRIAVITNRARRRRDALTEEGHRANLHEGVISAEEIAADEEADEARKRGITASPSTIARWMRSGHPK